MACHAAGNETYNEIVFSPENDDMVEIFTPLGDSDDAKQFWSEGAVKLMLALVDELQPKVGKSIAVKTRSKMFKIVSERMAAEKHTFNPEQIQNKFRALERQYKKTVINNRQTGRSRQTCPYEK